MRVDQYIQNDSGALSVVTGSALPQVVADWREDDARFCRDNQALLLMLYGDDSATVRVVVDEPLTADEQAEWVARASAWIEVQDGSVVVMGGFDPRTVQDWLERTPGDAGPLEVMPVSVSNGLWHVDVYAYLGSLNGNYLLEELSGFEVPDEEDAASPVVGYLVHFSRVHEGATRPVVPADGWFEVEHGARRLATLPRGLPTMVRITDV